MVDKLDLKILRLLEADGSLAYTEIARKLRLNESTVRKRILTMKDRGVIKKFLVVLDPAKIGLNTMAIVGVDAAPDRLLEIAKELVKMPETKCVATSTGNHMIMTEIWARDGEDLSQILSKKIGTIKGVTKICPAIILEKMKG